MAHHSQEALGKFSYEVVPQLSSEDYFPMQWNAQPVLLAVLLWCAHQSLMAASSKWTLATIWGARTQIRHVICQSVTFTLWYSGELSKGMSGKVATIGGCREYTGAPYFASITCLRVSPEVLCSIMSSVMSCPWHLLVVTSNHHCYSRKNAFSWFQQTLLLLLHLLSWQQRCMLLFWAERCALVHWATKTVPCICFATIMQTSVLC